MSEAELGDREIWCAVRVLRDMGRESVKRFAMERGGAMDPGSESGMVTWVERVQKLETENTRLQALLCYLMHVNEELRSKQEDKDAAGPID